MSKGIISKEVIIFDWDGTLFDSVSTIVRSVQLACEQLGMPVPETEYVRKGIGLGEAEVCHYLFGKDVVPVNDFWTTYRSIYADFPIVLFDHVENALNKLKQSGFKLAVATNKCAKEFERELNLSGMAPYFSTWICADQSVAKPNPAMLLEVAKRLDCVPEQIFMVGDTTHDAHAAQAAGASMFALTWGVCDRVDLEPCSTEVFDDIHQLTSFLMMEKEGCKA